MTPAIRRTALVHLAANALLLALGYYWLGLAESRAATLAWSAFVALFFAALLCWTYGAAFACLEENPWRTALRNLLPLAAAAILVTAVYVLLSALDSASTKPASQIASWLTLKTRKPVRPLSILRVFQTVIWVLWWVVVPVFVLPLLSRVANRGWRGFRFTRSTRSQWVITPVLLLLGLWAPLKLIGWVPRFGGFGLEAMSFLLRAAIAYLLFAGSLLLLAFLTSGGKPRATQPSTVASP